MTKMSSRKGRPKGAKNLAVRKDKGVKKGPRKSKTNGVGVIPAKSKNEGGEPNNEGFGNGGSKIYTAEHEHCNKNEHGQSTSESPGLGANKAAPSFKPTSSAPRASSGTPPSAARQQQHVSLATPASRTTKIKSEKRSASMARWWEERKKKQANERIRLFREKELRGGDLESRYLGDRVAVGSDRAAE